ncbi:MAG: hypothetical protein LUO93_04685, partial [Methanomicrobiales archaeon]|nr:hypothetical protein [Methanomicrobiales archaeon]
MNGDVWDERSRKAVEGELDRAGFRLFETRARPPHPWEPRLRLTARLSRGDVASLLWLPFRSWSEAAAAWDAVASAAREDPARFVRLARGLAAAFDPAVKRPPALFRFRPSSAGREPLLSAAAILQSGFKEEELSWAAGVGGEEASGAIDRGRDAGQLVPEGDDGWRFAAEEQRRRHAGRLSAAARRSIVERLEKAGLSGGRLTVAALARGEPGDLHAAQALLEEASRRGDRALAFELLARAPAGSPDLGRCGLAVRILWECGRVAEARAAATRLSASGDFTGSHEERSALSRVLARLGEADLALAMVGQDGSAAELLIRAQVLLDLKRTDEAARVLDGLPPVAG